MARVAVITGGSSGLGLAMARELLARGLSVVLLARDEARLAQARFVLQISGSAAQPGSLQTVRCDVTSERDLQTAFERVRSEHEGIDYLVLNAGVTTVDLLEDHPSLESVRRTIEVNLLGAVAATYLAMPLLRPGARLLFISSGFGLVGSAGYATYSASKGGMNLFAEALRRELKGQCIRVHLACPGDIDTSMYRRELEEMPLWVKRKMGRGRPLEVNTAARRILDACDRGKFLITTSADVGLLVLVRKLLPMRWSTWLIDQVLPSPPARPALLAESRVTGHVAVQEDA